jgi:putative ABC transport system substrate-binding protein
MQLDHLKRREFVTLLGGAAVWPLAPRAQPSTLPVIGFLHPGSPDANAKYVAGFRKGLGETGYIEGRNVAIEYRWGQGDSARLPELAAELVRRPVTVIATPGSLAASLAAKAETASIPIVYASGPDPVQAGLSATLNRPGGNVTGISAMNAVLAAKQLGLLRELFHRHARFGFLHNPANPQIQDTLADVRTAASAIGQQLELLAASTAGDISPAFRDAVQRGVEALLISPDPLFTGHQVQLATLAARHVMPALYTVREFAEAGGLMSYGSSFIDTFRQAGIYTGRILKGETPADMPIMQATKFELVLNLQTAEALGIEVPATLLALADEVIE